MGTIDRALCQGAGRENRRDEGKGPAIIGQKQEAKPHVANVRDELVAIGRRCAARPDLDRRPPDEILGYDEIGLPS
jgi:hypothetical protein